MILRFDFLLGVLFSCAALSVGACDAGMDPPVDSGGGAGGEPQLGACSAPVEHQGFVQCREGYRHRVSQNTCGNVEREGRIASGPCGIEGECCEFDSDCAQDAACWLKGHTGQDRSDTYGTCAARCETDDDCAGSEICECGDGAGRCVASSCTTASDCAGDELCVRSAHDEGCGQHVQYTCQTPQDECVSDKDCAADAPDFETCASDGTRRVCLNQYQSCDS
jgi:hypothetical protein